MCGIAGYKTSAPVDAGVLRNMVDALLHRGPDSSGYYRSNDYSAGIRRLSINDVQGGNQPLYNEDKSVVLQYNGEIYNSPALREKLEQRGHVFRTHSDGEVICHLYEEYGEDLFEQLDGMFAAALWSEPEQKLILARDFAGEKPLYYASIGNDGIAFSSEIKSLIKFPGLDLALNEQALWDFPTFLWVPEPSTIYRSIMALPRGHLLRADSRGLKIRSYRNRFNPQAIDVDDEAGVINETRRVVTDAVHSRLLSDVPIGSFLSGGLDSSIVAALATKAVGKLDTFCIAFDNVADPYHGFADESAEAAIMAKSIGSRHHVIRITAQDFRRDLPAFCNYGDQPFAVSSGLGILSVARAAHDAGIKVLLSGDGADECFGGYSWYPYLKEQAGIHPAAMPPADASPLTFQNFGVDLQSRLAAIYSYPPAKRAWAWHYYAAESEKSALFNRDRFEATRSSLRFFDDFKSAADWTPEDFIRQDREFYFPNEMLRKVDRMTMAHSVESRVPFAAAAVLSHADKLKYKSLIKDGSLKWVLRRAFEDLLPQALVNRPKHGFNVPIDHWLKNEWSDLVDDAFSPDSALTKSGLVRRDSRKVAAGMLRETSRLNGHTIFCYIMLNYWLENCHGNNC